MKRIYIACVTACALALASCGNSETSNSSVNEDSLVVVEDDIVEDTINREQEFLHLDSIYYNMDINKLSYNDLYFLLHYPYAKHAFWFKEYDLNAKYCSLDWYKKLINDTYYHVASYTTSRGKTEEYFELRNDLDTVYWHKWYRDYDNLKKSTKLTPEESTFVSRVSARMAELEREKYIDVEGFKLYNSDQIVNIEKGDSVMLPLLKKYGFALTETNYPQLFNIYEENDYSMTPSYITTDVMLQLFNVYQRYVLDGIEQDAIAPALQKLCEGLYEKSKAIANQEAIEDIKDLAEFSTTYFAIALSLLNEKTYDVPASYKEKYKAELALIKGESDEISPLLNTEVRFGYSMFKPRAQYTRTEESKRYFRTMMWLQTAYLCAKDNGLQKALFMAIVFENCNSKIKDAASQAFDPLNYLIGEPNNIPILELSNKLNELGITDYTQLIDDDILRKATTAIIEANRSKNSIQPKIAISCQPKINFIPQRYVPDADILNMMADSVPNAARAYPRGVDVFDAFGIKAAKALNDTFFTDNKKWKEYPMQRKKASDKFAKFNDWDKTGYNKWIKMLVDMQQPDKNYPGFMQTSSWQLKNLNSALASWSELKHNTILYSIQPLAAECGDGGDPKLPDPVLVGYVEPNLKFWKTLRQAIEQTYNMALRAGYDVKEDFGVYRNIEGQTKSFLNQVNFLINISEKELKGQQLTDQEYETIRTLGSNIEYMTRGFLADRHHYADWAAISDVNKRMPVVADIYTRNVVGCQKSGILHTAVGNANSISVVVEINGHFYLTCGATFSYYEFIRPVGTRLTDEEWQKLNGSDDCPNVPEWITPFMLNEPKPKGNVDYLYSSGC